MFMRKTAILGIALLAVALAGCGKKADEHASENQMAPADQHTPAPAAPETAPAPAPSEQPGMGGTPAGMTAPTEPAQAPGTPTANLTLKHNRRSRRANIC